MGFGVRDESGPYPARLERLLNEFLTGPTSFEVINLGVDGYSSEQVRRLFDTFGADLGADAVIVQVGFNDYCFAEVPDHEARFEAPVWRDVTERSHAYRWFRRTLLSAAGRTPALSTPGHRVPLDRYVANLTAIISRARSTGATVYLLTTPARPRVPLVINEVLVDGDRYVTQSAWLAEWLRDAGIGDDAPLGDPVAIAALRAARAEHPSWPHLAFMLERQVRAAGDSAGAAVLEAEWRALDTERAVLARYADVVRSARSSVGVDPDRPAASAGAAVEVVDLEEVLAAYRASQTRNDGDLYIDFVHLDAIGHVVVATELARRIAARLTGSGG
jgi:lysophospholipase L1-like esterase